MRKMENSGKLIKNFQIFKSFNFDMNIKAQNCKIQFFFIECEKKKMIAMQISR